MMKINTVMCSFESSKYEILRVFYPNLDILRLLVTFMMPLESTRDLLWKKTVQYNNYYVQKNEF